MNRVKNAILSQFAFLITGIIAGGEVRRMGGKGGLSEEEIKELAETFIEGGNALLSDITVYSEQTERGNG